MAAAAAACRRAVSYTLRGPPGESLAAAVASAAKAAKPTTGDPFVDLLDANFNKPAPPPPPKTRTENNSPTFATSGDPCLDFFFHDLPEILHRIIHGGASTRTPGKQARLAAEGRGFIARLRLRMAHSEPRKEVPELERHEKKRTRKARVAASQKRDLEEAAQATVERRKKRADAAATAVQSCYDRSTLICEAIARRLFPKGSALDLPEDLPDAHYAFRARERLRKEAYVPLRHALKLPETFMSAGEWGKVVYTRVASVAMKNYKDHFIYYDQERFNGYLADVKPGKKKIAAGALLPHKILESAVDGEDEVADLQWKRMVDDLLALGKLNNCLAVCDVSGSMHGVPMDVCVALGLLLSELCDEPWRHRVITFSAAPQLHRIRGETLSEKAEFICEMEWGMNTDFQAVFDQLLRVAVAGKVPPERMVKKVFVFSDMEFDQASARPWETDYEAITRKYAEAGYGDAVPQVVFWNLRASRSVPVTAEQKGVALVSGFSKNMLELFLGGDHTPSPRAVMDKPSPGPCTRSLSCSTEE
uniref:Uncharacterized protein n=1 Tax=Aegilops tauschii TaxID=37682 RepID=N1QVM6_AEGTA